MITTSPANMRVDTRYAVDLTPITSSASISSLIRMAPSSAVAPAPTGAARAVPVRVGAARRTLVEGDHNPGRGPNTDVAQRPQTLDRDERPGRHCHETDDPRGAADHGHRAGA